MSGPDRTPWSRGILVLTATLVIGCQGYSGGRALLPEPPKDQLKLSSYEPASPYRQLAPGILSRKVFDAPDAADHAVGVLDLFIAPGHRASDVALPGGAVFEVRTGHGALTTSGNKQEVKTGSTFAVSQGASFTLENTGDVPMTIRVFVITAR
jgi:hypothetical protein